MNKLALFVKSAIVTGVYFLPIQAIACDTCAETAIVSGFAKIEAQAALLNASAQSLATAISGLQSTVTTGNTSVSNAIAGLTNTLSTSLTLMNEQVTTAIEGGTVANSLEMARQNAMLKQLSNSYREETKSMMATALKLYSNFKAYNTIGEGSNFIYAGELDALQDMYYNSEQLKENAFNIYMQAVSESTGAAGFSSGGGAILTGNVVTAWNNKDSLLTSLKYKKVLTEEEFNKLILIASAYIGEDDSLKTISKKATFLKLVLDKAPIFRISSSELKAVTPFEPEFLSYDLCSKESVPEDNYCTSTFALLNALEKRVTDSTYLNAINITREKGVLQELSRSLSIGNIIKGRTLDIKTSESLTDIFDG